MQRQPALLERATNVSLAIGKSEHEDGTSKAENVQTLPSQVIATGQRVTDASSDSQRRMIRNEHCEGLASDVSEKSSALTLSSLDKPQQTTGTSERTPMLKGPAQKCPTVEGQNEGGEEALSIDGRRHRNVSRSRLAASRHMIRHLTQKRYMEITLCMTGITH